MPFPRFDYCIICDGVRPEVGGKATILGFYGLTPNVEIVIVNPNIPTTLGLIAGFPPIADRAEFQHSFVITKPDQQPLVRTPPARLHTSPAGRGAVVFGFVIPPPYVFGNYSIQIFVNNEPKLETSIRLRQVTQAELGMLAGGGAIPPPPMGRAN